MDEAVKGLRINISGCFNSCGQHHVADIGFYGNSRKVAKRTVPHFQVILGGQWTENAGAYGLAVGSVPSKAVPAVVEALTDAYAAGREKNESFQSWIGRLGKREVRNVIQPFMHVPAYEEDKSFYTDWGDAREFTIGDLGVGECAGEVVSLFGIEVVKAEGLAFDAQVALDERSYAEAEDLAYQAMLTAARSLVRAEYIDVSEDPDDIVERVQDSASSRRSSSSTSTPRTSSPATCCTGTPKGAGRGDLDAAKARVEEALLFIEAAHACDARSSVQAPHGPRGRRPDRAAQRMSSSMNPKRIAVKFFTDEPGAPVALEPFIPLFHRFIQQATVPGLLIDVANYIHVPNGPGVVLVGHEVDYGIDAVGGRTGLLTVRKRGRRPAAGRAAARRPAEGAAGHPGHRGRRLGEAPLLDEGGRDPDPRPALRAQRRRRPPNGRGRYRVGGGAPLREREAHPGWRPTTPESPSPSRRGRWRPRTSRPCSHGSPARPRPARSRSRPRPRCPARATGTSPSTS